MAGNRRVCLGWSWPGCRTMDGLGPREHPWCLHPDATVYSSRNLGDHTTSRSHGIQLCRPAFHRGVCRPTVVQQPLPGMSLASGCMGKSIQMQVAVENSV